ncbi:MAG: FUSC family protein [Microbacterium sp.]|uniref:FUSC family protein n=1 Tax=Microbacterium sp. TaxID=51671 RepID=UPI001AD5136D|nr:FUSC family protein [Microbacterium sp.]MBN9178081.1 FUSC family protein [Microbacterium sp.]
MNWSLRAPRRSPLLQVVKSAVATLAAWLLAGWLIAGPPPVFAAIAALLTVQPSITQSFGRGVERTVGVVAGVVVASLIGIVWGGGFGAVALSIVCALLMTWALRATPGTANQVAISAMLVLALGTATPGYALDRVLETLLGAAIGLVVNLAIVPPLALDPARGRVAELTADTAAALDRLGDALLAPQNTASLAALLAEAREVRGAVAAAEQALGEARDSLALNPRGRRSREEVRELVDAVTRLSAITTQVTGMTRAFVDDYDVSTATDADVAAIAEQLHRAAHDLRLGAPGALTDEPPALTRPLELRTAPPQHWVLIGSLMVDMRRIHDALAARE